MANIRDVAKTAAVSTATVSAVLNESAFVSAELRSKVLDAVKRLNYTPKSAARALRPGGHAMFFEPFNGWAIIRLAFERSTIDIVAYLLTGLGILALVWMRRQGDMDLRRQMVWASSAGTAPLDPHHVTAPALADVWSEPPPDDSEPPPDGVVFDDRRVESGAPGAFLDEPLPEAPHAGDTAGSETVGAEADDPDSLGPR